MVIFTENDIIISMKKIFFITIALVLLVYFLTIFTNFFKQDDEQEFIKEQTNNLSDENNIIIHNDIIKVISPLSNDLISSPLMIKGEARGPWYFEADFPIRIEDANGNIIAEHFATAKDEWMTENFVPFSAEIEFEVPDTEEGFLILIKDNPSDKRELDDELKIPVRFQLEYMDLIIYIQDQEIAFENDCSAVKQFTARVPRTLSVVDESLRILFNEELKFYGRYSSVNVSNGVAYIMLESNFVPNTQNDSPTNERNIESLSSCEISHLMAVLENTLTQYESIDSFKIMTPLGEVNF